MDSEEITQQKNKKRNMWTYKEVCFFLSLIQEKKVLGLMDGKRLRVSDIFKTLVAPMKEQGFIRDAQQLIIKYKNLKVEYYKCKRHNNTSGNNPYKFEFFQEMDELFGHRPISQSQRDEIGFENMSDVPVVSDEDLEVQNNIIDVDVEIIEQLAEDVPDIDGAIPGGSKEPGIKKIQVSATQDYANTLKNKKIKNKTHDLFSMLFKEFHDNRKEEISENKKVLKEVMDHQEKILMNCTQSFLLGLEKIFNSENTNN